MLDGVVLDHCVGQELAAHLVEPGFRLGRVGFGELELDELALADVAHLGKAQPVEGMSDGLALGVEHAVLEGHVNSGFHFAPYWKVVDYCSVVGPRTSPGPWSIRMPSRRAT